jgi:hypothetical protein
MVEHAAAMLKQSSHRDIVDVAQKVEIGKARFGAVFERVISRIKLPALRFGHITEPLSTVVTLNLVQGQFISLNRRLCGTMDPETSSG